ncbi:hypothetical protein FJTKL_00216 [Diaporthe vaccinii]|uniref:Secreted protein n=1 Tax=Diaporthe vaccinii TaxID=105482 RepID=A0ABR4E3T0_9PEZI
MFMRVVPCASCILVSGSWVQPLSTEHFLLTVPLGQGRCVQDKVKDKCDTTEKLGNLGRVWGKEGRNRRHASKRITSR